jgi:hypothetical protein
MRSKTQLQQQPFNNLSGNKPQSKTKIQRGAQRKNFVMPQGSPTTTTDQL